MSDNPTPGDDLVERDPLALAMFAAWVNVPVDQIPETMKGHTCAATMSAWKRVGEAAMAFLRTRDEAALSSTDEEVRNAAIDACAKIEMDREGYPLSRTQEEIYSDAAETVDAVIANLRPADEEVRRLRAEVDRLTMNGVHTCHDRCQRIACVQRREINQLRGSLIELIAAMRKYEMDVDADAPAAHREMMRRAEEALQSKDTPSHGG